MPQNFADLTTLKNAAEAWRRQRTEDRSWEIKSPDDTGLAWAHVVSEVGEHPGLNANLVVAFGEALLDALIATPRPGMNAGG